MVQDIQVLKNDFEIIKQKIVNGQAHLLSEGDTSYLGASVRANSALDRVKQPNTNIPAIPRAFVLKVSYLTGILRSSLIEVENTIYKTVEEYVYDRIKPYIGMKQSEIYEQIFL